MNEKRIYEWLKPIHATLEQFDYPQEGTWTYVYGKGHINESRYACPPLDYNTLHNEVIPKVKAEGIIMWFDGTSWYLDEPGTENLWMNTDWREALDAMLAAREGK